MLQLTILFSSLFIFAKLAPGVNAKLRFQWGAATNDKGRKLNGAMIEPTLISYNPESLTGGRATTSSSDTEANATTNTHITGSGTSSSENNDMPCGCVDFALTTTANTGVVRCTSGNCGTSGISSSNAENPKKTGMAGYQGVSIHQVSSSKLKTAKNTKNTGKVQSTSTVGCISGDCGTTSALSFKASKSTLKGYGVTSTDTSKSKSSKSTTSGTTSVVSSQASKSTSKGYGITSTGISKSKLPSSTTTSASGSTSTLGCCSVDFADTTTGLCVKGTTVELVTSDLKTIIDKYTVTSLDQCSCMLSYGDKTAENYCNKIVPTSGYSCDGSGIKQLTTDTSGLIMYINTIVVTTSSTMMASTETTHSDYEPPETGSVTVSLFHNYNNNLKEDGANENLTGLEIKLIDTSNNEQTLVSACENNTFFNVKPGAYSVKSQDAIGYACDCEKVVVVQAGVDSIVTIHR